MNEPELDIPEEFYAYKSRATTYIARLSGFPFQWALPDSSTTQTGFPTSFFRWDQRRFRRLIQHAEHLIRCLIIWMAYARLRSGLVRSELSSVRHCAHMGRAQSCSQDHAHQQGAGAERPEPQAMEPRSSITNNAPSIHPHFVLRGLRLYYQNSRPFGYRCRKALLPGWEKGLG